MIRGCAIDYDKLADGDGLSGKLLPKKYFGGDSVKNFCLRQYVFVATGLREQ